MLKKFIIRESRIQNILSNVLKVGFKIEKFYRIKSTNWILLNVQHLKINFLNIISNNMSGKRNKRSVSRSID